MEAGRAFSCSRPASTRRSSPAPRVGVPMLPGACTPGEIERALAAGIGLLKFFPAEAAGGVPSAVLAGPYPEVSFVPTGGIGPADLRRLPRAPDRGRLRRGWMVKASLVSSGDLASVTRLTAEALSVARAKDQAA